MNSLRLQSVRIQADPPKPTPQTALICKICFDAYTHSEDKRPHVISCGHTLCLRCTKELYKAHQGGLKCPFCMQFSRYTHIGQIPTNYEVFEQLIEKQNFDLKEVFKKYNCFNHYIMKYIFNYVFKAKFGISKPQYCSIHKDEPLTFYCKTHATYACQVCALTQHMGKKHDLISARLQDAGREAQDLELWADGVREQIFTKLRHVDMRCTDLNASHQRATRNLIRLLKRELKKVVKQNEAMVKQETQYLQGQVKKMDQVLSNVQNIANKIAQQSFEEEDLSQFQVIELLIKDVQEANESRQPVQLGEKLNIPQCYSSHIEFQSGSLGINSSIDGDFSIESPPESSKEESKQNALGVFSGSRPQFDVALGKTESRNYRHGRSSSAGSDLFNPKQTPYCGNWMLGPSALACMFFPLALNFGTYPIASRYLALLWWQQRLSIFNAGIPAQTESCTQNEKQTLIFQSQGYSESINDMPVMNDNLPLNKNQFLSLIEHQQNPLLPINSVALPPDSSNAISQISSDKFDKIKMQQNLYICLLMPTSPSKTCACNAK